MMLGMMNFFTPGFGLRPPLLAGREEALQTCGAGVQRILSGGAPDPVFISGLHGAGKTALLEAAQANARSQGALTIVVAAREGSPLFGALVGPLRAALARRIAPIANSPAGERALSALASFAKTHARTATPGALEAVAGLADTGDVETDAAELLAAIAGAAASEGSAAVLYVDDIERARLAEVSALCAALGQARAAGGQVALVASGLSRSDARAQEMAERLGPVSHVQLGALPLQAAVVALNAPAAAAGVKFTEQALSEIIAGSGRHPFFLQQWAASALALATDPLIDRRALERARRDIEAELDVRFHGVVLAEATASEWGYLRAVAELGVAVAGTAETAAHLGMPMSAAAPIRASLIAKRVLYSPERGRAAFAAPGLGGYILRAAGMAREPAPAT